MTTETKAAAQQQEPQNKTTVIAYPMWAWEGTPYYDYAEACQKGNYIPKRFFVESLKTVVGAICGHRLKRPNSRIEARFYTVIMADTGGTGKSTSKDWAIFNMFAETGLVYRDSQEQQGQRMKAEPDYGDEPNIFGSAGPIVPAKEGNVTAAANQAAQAGYFNKIGCYFGGFGSGTGLLKRFAKNDRVLQVYDELATMVEKFGIAGSGQHLLAMNNELYEGTVPTPNETKESSDKGAAKLPAAVRNSILGCTIKEKWDEMFGNTSATNSGFFQRLNLVSGEDIKVVADLVEPELGEIRESLLKKIAVLEAKPCIIATTPEAKQLFEEWYTAFRIKTKGEPSDVTGRINVIVVRNAMQIAWLLSTEPHTATITVDVMQRAFALADYQYLTRQANRPLAGRNDYARLENAVKRELKKRSPLMRMELYRLTHADRFGEGALDNVIERLHRAGCITTTQAVAAEGQHQGGRRKMLVTWLGDD